MLSISNEQHRPQGIHEITACTCNRPQHLYCPVELVYQNKVSSRWKYFLAILSLSFPQPKLTTGRTNAEFQSELMWFSQGMWIGSVNTSDGYYSDFVDLLSGQSIRAHTTYFTCSNGDGYCTELCVTFNFIFLRIVSIMQTKSKIE